MKKPAQKISQRISVFLFIQEVKNKKGAKDDVNHKAEILWLVWYQPSEEAGGNRVENVCMGRMLTTESQ